MPDPIRYPRRRLVRSALRLAGRLLLPLLTRTRLTGRENFPLAGPLILVGNHTAAMEVVLMTVCSPRPVEYLGSVDIPPEGAIGFFINLYGFIPVFRGKASPAALQAGLEVLRLGGVLGIFPEGGIWEPAIRRAQAGAAWLSHHGRAPVLPIGFGSTRGALREIFALRRPVLEMNVGPALPPVEIRPGPDRKAQLQAAADRIMDRVWELIPAADRRAEQAIRDERFELRLEALGPGGQPAAVPPELQPREGAALAKFIHRWTLINNFRVNLGIEVGPLIGLADDPDPQALKEALRAVLAYLENDNPYYFTYRYGPKEGAAMQAGLRELERLLDWAGREGCRLKAAPLRRFVVNATGQEVCLDRPESHAKW